MIRSAVSKLLQVATLLGPAVLLATLVACGKVRGPVSDSWVQEIRWSEESKQWLRTKDAEGDLPNCVREDLEKIAKHNDIVRALKSRKTP